MPQLLPLAEWPLSERQRITGVFTDIDDTLTTAGELTGDALAALQDLRRTGIPVIAITGRATGWCLPKMREWPVEAMGAEGGAVLLLPPAPGGDGAPRKLYIQDAPTRVQHQARLQAVADQVLREVPGVRIAPGAEGRETDIAFDHHEFANLSERQLARVKQLLLDAGLTVAVSSIHIHGRVDAHDKFTGACWILRTLHGRDLALERSRWAFVGDSANDEAMFQGLSMTAIGVANVQEAAGGLQHWPRFVTQGKRGAGFAEVARALIASRAPARSPDSPS
ncbi:MAG: HAD-IIB family hydrolase [Rhodoferax sp.]|nr:HAD-IIB family hydrolase [Rhodoferax sp.]